jgi:hypothetical protein
MTGRSKNGSSSFFIFIYLKKIFFGPMPLFLFCNTQTMHIKSKPYNSIAMFFLKPYTLVGFEPGSAVSEAAGMSTAPRRQGSSFVILKIF